MQSPLTVNDVKLQQSPLTVSDVKSRHSSVTVSDVTLQQSPVTVSDVKLQQSSVTVSDVKLQQSPLILCHFTLAIVIKMQNTPKHGYGALYRKLQTTEEVPNTKTLTAVPCSVT